MQRIMKNFELALKFFESRAVTELEGKKTLNFFFSTILQFYFNFPNVILLQEKI